MSKNNGTKRELAELLSRVMKHPKLPEMMSEKLGNLIVDMSTEIDYDSPELIELALIASDSNAKKRRTK